jgi:hypothetical protein
MNPSAAAMADLFLTPEEVATVFRRPGDKRFVYRHAAPGGFLAPHARRFGRLLLFERAGIEALARGHVCSHAH